MLDALLLFVAACVLALVIFSYVWAGAFVGMAVANVDFSPGRWSFLEWLVVIAVGLLWPLVAAWFAFVLLLVVLGFASEKVVFKVQDRIRR